MSVAFKHIPLLIVNGHENIKKLLIGNGQHNAVVFDKIIDISKVTANILKLLFDRFSDLFRTALSAFGKCKIVFSCLLAVHSRSVKSVFVGDSAQHIFKLFTNFIQQLNVLRILDVLRRTGRIKDQCAGVFSFFFGIICGILLIGLTSVSAHVIRIVIVLLRVVLDDHFIDLVENILR